MKKGFTLIEIIVVIGVVLVTIPAVFAVLFGILRQQAKVYALKQVKEEGDFVLTSTENLIRNYATSIHSGQPTDSNIICNAPAADQNAAYFRDRFGNWFRLYTKLDGGINKISSQSSILNGGAQGEVFLTSDKVRIPTFSLTCRTGSSFSSPVVSINFQIEFNTSSTRAEDKATLNYQTKVKLRTLP